MNQEKSQPDCWRAPITFKNVHCPLTLHTCHITHYVGDKAFPVTAVHLWNSLPSNITAAPSLSIFCSHLKSHLFSLSYPSFRLFSHLYSAHAVTRHFGHYNRFNM